MLLSATLQQIQAKFQAQGIQYLVYKGLPLAQQVYPNWMARFSSDIDLLVAEHQLDQATAQLQSLGFRNQVYEDLNPTQARWFRTTYKDVGWLHPHTNVLVELHWRLTQNPAVSPLSAEEVREALRNPHWVTVNNQAMPTLPLDTMLVYLLWHGSHHRWFRLTWLLDIALLIQQRELDWPGLMKQFNQRHLRLPVAWGLNLVHQLLHIELPAEILHWVQTTSGLERCMTESSKCLSMPEREVKQYLFGNEKSWSAWVRDLQFQLHLYPGFKARWCEVRRALFYPKREDLMWLKLPQHLAALYPMVAVTHTLYRVVKPKKLNLTAP